MLQEEWKQINGYTRYFISSYGRIKSFPPEKISRGRKSRRSIRILKPYIDSHTGYLKITLFQNKTANKFYIHQLVWDAFGNKPRNNGLQIDHIDANRQNPRIDNLQLLTKSENLRKGHQERGRALPSGIYWLKNKERFRVEYKNQDGKRCMGGTFRTLEEAIMQKSKIELNKEDFIKNLL